MMFDCYKTLVNISTDENSVKTYEPLSKWLSYYGVRLSPDELMREYKRLCKEAIERSWEMHTEIKVEDIFARICRERASWPINEVTVGIEAARIFRSSIRQSRGLRLILASVFAALDTPRWYHGRYHVSSPRRPSSPDGPLSFSGSW